VAVFLLTTPTLPSPIKGEGARGRGKSHARRWCSVIGWWEEDCEIIITIVIVLLNFHRR